MREITRPPAARCTIATYIAFLLGEPRHSTCCRLAGLVGISHDSVNRFLLREDYTPKDLFDQSKQHLDLIGGVLSVDDTVLDKPYSYQVALVGHFWSGKHHCAVKGINLITMYHTDKDGHHSPVNYRIYNKADGKTKNDYFLEMLDELLVWGVEPVFVTGDSWYSGTKNLKSIKNDGLGSLFALKSNRLVSVEKGGFVHVSTLDIPEDGLEVWLRGFGKVKVFRTLLKNERRHYAVHLPDESALAILKREKFLEVHDKHWQIEQYHRVIKQVCHVEDFQVRSEVAIRNHIFAALLGFVQLQKMCTAELISNCYKLQRDLFNDVIINFIRKLVPEIKNLDPEFTPVANA
jgi:hypothetical protein